MHKQSLFNKKLCVPKLLGEAIFISMVLLFQESGKGPVTETPYMFEHTERRFRHLGEGLGVE